MSAKWDNKQGIRFYYGNAARDLADSLPREEAVSAFAPKPEDLLELLTVTEEHIAKIEAAQKELSFLVADLKRMIR
jgi:hypothetical protein